MKEENKMGQTIYLSPDVLKPHPRNSEFFDSASGDDYVRLKQSIAELGILTPLKVSADMTIISGHQRYHAAKELGMRQIPVIIDDELCDEDDKLQQLIAANFGRMKNDPVKQGKWLKEYERLRGVRQGSARQKIEGNNSPQVTQEDIARELGVDKSTVKNLKRLAMLIPELQDIISSGQINATTGFKLLARLSEEEQRELLAKLPTAKKLTQAEVQKYVAQLKNKDNEIANRDAEIARQEGEIAALTAEKAEIDRQKEEAERVAKEALEAVTEHEARMRNDDTQRTIDQLETERRDFYEKYKKTKEELEREKRDRRRAENKLEDILHPPIGQKPPAVTVYPPDYAQLQEKARHHRRFKRTNLQASGCIEGNLRNKARR